MQLRLGRPFCWLCLTCAATILLDPPAAWSADWTHWRGVNRNDIVVESSGWDGKQWRLDEAWSGNVGKGSTSPLVVANRLYTMGSTGKTENVMCLDAASGKTLWKESYAAPLYGRKSTGDKSIYSGPSSTPEFDPKTGYLYTLGIDGDLRCWNTRNDGREVWALNLYDRFAAQQRPDVGGNGQSRRDYGYTSSPLVFQETLLVEVGDTKTGTLKGFNKLTGKLLWTSKVKDEAGHSGGPVPIIVERTPCVALLTMRNLVVVRLDAGHVGETVAVYPWTTDFANNIPTPAVHGNSVIITSAYNKYAMCRLDVTLGQAKRVWEINDPSGVCSPLIHDGHVYWAWRGIHCVDWKTGRTIWKGNKVGTAGSCLVTSDDRLVVWADRGKLSLVETVRRSPGNYTELAHRNALFRRDAWPHIVLAGRRFYCKDRDGNLKCLVIQGES
ncbi:MAG: PQQ-binding-like beta-propeller repeat protein [Pirellulaceae bacterium]|nr:PQQ-binding-like beta-propeller repeat protein [Pirellulaceae bacterium]